jgi:hypothetical protein
MDILVQQLPQTCLGALSGPTTPGGCEPNEVGGHADGSMGLEPLAYEPELNPTRGIGQHHDFALDRRILGPHLADLMAQPYGLSD